MKQLTLGKVPLTGECLVIYSVRRFGGFFVHVLFKAEADQTIGSVQVIVPEGAMVWTVPPSDWDGLWRVDDLPPKWRRHDARPAAPVGDPFADAFRDGVAERVAWWAETRQLKLAAIRLTLATVRVHPTDTSPGICEQAGREMIDELISCISAR